MSAKKNRWQEAIAELGASLARLERIKADAAAELEALDSPRVRAALAPTAIQSRKAAALANGRDKASPIAREALELARSVFLDASARADRRRALREARFAPPPLPVPPGASNESAAAVEAANVARETLDVMQRIRWRAELADASADRLVWVLQESVTAGDVALVSMAVDAAEGRTPTDPAELAKLRTSADAAIAAVELPEADAARDAARTIRTAGERLERVWRALETGNLELGDRERKVSEIAARGVDDYLADLESGRNDFVQKVDARAVAIATAALSAGSASD